MNDTNGRRLFPPTRTAGVALALLVFSFITACANDAGPQPGVLAPASNALSVLPATRAVPDAGVTLAQGQTARIQVETGSHSAPLRAIETSGDGQLVFTASDDKSARLWDAQTGALRHVLRPALGDANVGRMYALAVHPARPLLAVAGTTSAAAGGHRILLFDTRTGGFERAFDARGGNIKRMAWARGGSILLATYDGQHGLRAFGADGAPLFEDAYDAASYGLTVSPDGTRVATTSLDGWVRVYRVGNAGLELVKRWRPSIPGPRDIAFAPDGERLAVGYIGSPQNPGAPTVFAAMSGAVLQQMSRPDLAAGDLRSVAWARDGRTLYAGGSGYLTPGRHALHAFDVGTGREQFAVMVARNSINDLKVSADGAVLFAGFDGSWGRVRDRRFEMQVGGDVADLRGPTALLTDASGRRVSFRFGLDRPATVFDLESRLLRSDQAGDRLSAPRTDGPRGDVWENVRQPVVNGRPIRLDEVEASRSIDYLANGDALLGSSMALRRIDGAGNVLWRAPTNAEVWSVNASSDGRFALTALSDGTIRWWRAADGNLLMSLFMRPDGRWAVWSPAGYFDASVRADQMIGWAVNRDNEPVADFFTLSRFREQFNRPDVIDRLLDAGDLAAALAQADQDRARQILAQAPAPASGATAAAAGGPPAVPAGTAVSAATTGSRAATAPAGATESAAATAPAAATGSAGATTSAATTAPGATIAPATAATSEAAESPPAAAGSDAAQSQPVPGSTANAEANPTPADAAAGSTGTVAVARPPGFAPAAGFGAVDLGRLKPQIPASAALSGSAASASVGGAIEVSVAKKLFLPPILQPAGPTVLAANGAGVSIPFAVRSQGRPEIKVLVDGRPNPNAVVEPPAAFDGKSRGIATLSSALNASVVQLIASDQHGSSEPLNFRLETPAQAGGSAPSGVAPLSSTQSVVVVNPQSPDATTLAAAAPRLSEPAAPPPAASPSGSGPQRRLYVVSIGISRYRNPSYQLGLPAKDASDFLAAVRSQEGRLFRSVQARLLTDQNASRQATVDALEWLQRSVGPDDTGILFLAGHGLNGPAGNYFFMPWDADVQSLPSTAVPEAAFRQTLANARGRTVLFVDTCHAGAIGASANSNRELRKFANDLAAAENGVIVFASSSGRQVSEEDDAWGNGAFTKAVVEGLNGGADFRRTGLVTFKSLDYYVSEEVKRLTEGRQTPVTNIPVGVPDFALAQIS
ncbi:MAG: caspase family protein [Burkholderiaceae bacterium]